MVVGVESDDVNLMSKADLNVAEQLAAVIEKYQLERTGHAPTSVSVILGEDTLVVTLRDALTKAERTLAQTPEGAAQVQEFHRKLFASSEDQLCAEILRITGRKVQESAAEIQPDTGTVVHAFTTGAMVQMFMLTKEEPPPLSDETKSELVIDKGKDGGMGQGHDEGGSG